MKRIFIIIFFIVFSNLMVGAAQNTLAQTFIDEVARAFNSGNASILSEHFSNNVDINFGVKSALYSKSQAEMIFKGHFNKEKPISFKVNQRSFQEDNNLLYIISTYNNSKANYIVFMTFKWQENKYKIVEIQFKEL